MKKTVFLAYLALLLTFLSCLPQSPAADSRAQKAEAPESTAPPGELPPSETAPPAPAAETIRLLVGDAVLELDTQDYLTGVLAAEMPASFQPEALKAQAVAARTYALYCAAADNC